MQIRLVESATTAGDGVVNEDLFGGHGGAFWVMDGATPLDPSVMHPKSDARWLVEFVDERLRNVSATGLGIENIAETLRSTSEAIDQVLREEEFPASFVPPCCSVAIAWVNSETLFIATLGDISVVTHTSGNVHVIDDSNFSISERTAMHSSAVQNRGSETALEAGAVGIRQRRTSYINGTAGRFVFSRNPAAAQSIKIARIRVSNHDEILMATDGFVRMVDDYRIVPTWETLLAEARSSGLKPLLNRLRAYEQQNELTLGNHFKLRDDATAALLTVTC